MKKVKFVEEVSKPEGLFEFVEKHKIRMLKTGKKGIMGGDEYEFVGDEKSIKKMIDEFWQEPNLYFSIEPYDQLPYLVTTGRTAHELQTKVNKYINEGYITVGSHYVIVLDQTYTYAGAQPRTVISEREYSQTLILNFP